MKKTLILASIILFNLISLNISAQEKTIAWIMRAENLELTEGSDAFAESVLISEGYNVSKMNLASMTDDDVDVLNGMDLVIIGRGTKSSEFEANNKMLWNSVSAPVLCLNPYAVRSTKLNWFNTETTNKGSELTELAIEVLAENDAIFEGVDISNGVLATGKNSFIELADWSKSNAEVLATDFNGNPVIARFQPETEFYEGSMDMPASVRSYIGIGNDEGGVDNNFSFTEAGMNIFLNEVKNLIGTDVTSTESLSQAANIKLWPVPTHTKLNISNNSFNKPFTVEVFNVTGQSVLKTNKVSSNQFTLDISELTNGIYLVKVGNNTNQKIIKN